jgi:hypothetical protein
LSADSGLAPRARRDIAAAVAAGRFEVDDVDIALAVAGGALLGLGQLLADQPDRDDAAATDAVTRDLLRLWGLTARQADSLSTQPLPDIVLADEAASTG